MDGGKGDVSQRGKIEVYGRTGKQLPPGWVIDEQGNTRIDTNQILFKLVMGKASLIQYHFDFE